MRLVIFGATGTLGRHLVPFALAQGHRVTAFARRPETLELEHPALHRRAGDVLDREAVARAVAGQDAAIVALGAGLRGRLRAPGTRNVVDAMHAAGVSRLIVLSTLGAGDSARHLDFFWKYVMFGGLLRRAMADHEAQEAIVRASGLAWTLVRPAAFTDAPASGPIRHGDLDGAPLALKQPRSEVARFMLEQLTDDRYLHAAPALSC